MTRERWLEWGGWDWFNVRPTCHKGDCSRLYWTRWGEYIYHCPPGEGSIPRILFMESHCEELAFEGTSCGEGRAYDRRVKVFYDDVVKTELRNIDGTATRNFENMYLTLGPSCQMGIVIACFWSSIRLLSHTETLLFPHDNSPQSWAGFSKFAVSMILTLKVIFPFRLSFEFQETVFNVAPVYSSRTAKGYYTPQRALVTNLPMKIKVWPGSPGEKKKIAESAHTWHSEWS